MLFNSIDFSIFLPLVFIIYWLLNKNLKAQNMFIFTASYIFYGWWDWRFLLLIFFTTVLDYFIAQCIIKQTSNKKKKILFLTSIVINLSILGFFKYYNFFVENFITAFSFFGKQINPKMLHIILPVGISFYTFQTMSYVIDVYKQKITPSKDFIAFGAFVSFFPQLVAGPIERATHLLPQFQKKRTFNYSQSVDGMRQMLWGFFKKIVIADNCATIVNVVFENYTNHSSGMLVTAGILFSFQLYADFSGYSDIAIGCAKLFGINLTQNFKFPFFSRNFIEFWQRWHISLNSWFGDYVFKQLKGRTKFTIARNMFIVFLLTGLWHGANWTFIAWGVFLGTLNIINYLFFRKKKQTKTVAEGKNLPTWNEFFSMLTVFSFITISGVLFRSKSIKDFYIYIKTFFTNLNDSIQYLFVDNNLNITLLIASIMILFMLIIEWSERTNKHGLESLPKSKVARWLIYAILLILIITLRGEQQQFIYFQF